METVRTSDEETPGVRLAFATVILVVIASMTALLWSPLWVFPASWVLPADTFLDGTIKAFVDLSISGLTIADITRYVSSWLAFPIDLLGQALTDGVFLYSDSFGEIELQPLPWPAAIAFTGLLAWRLGGLKSLVLVLCMFAYVLVFGLWTSTMITFASVVAAVAITAVLGLGIGILCSRYNMLSAIMKPVYDSLQTIPIFSYLAVILIFFGFGQIAALAATVLFAMPPMARATELALRGTPAMLRELAEISGCTPMQTLFLVELPAARQSLLVGLNQITMLALSMVIIASIIGAGGLGADVLRGLKSMQLTNALLAGFAISIMAIAIDRTMRSWADPSTAHKLGARQFWGAFAAVVILTFAMAFSASESLIYAPSDALIETGRLFDDLLAQFNTNAQAGLAVWQGWFVQTIQVPLRNLMLALPWFPVAVFVAVLGWKLRGPINGLLLGAMITSLAVFGLWEQAMLSLFVVVLALFMAMVIGFPLGLFVGMNNAAYRVMEVVTDIIQTLPTFVYLIPVVVLFGAGDFPALMAVVIYLLAPIVRYTAVSLRHVPTYLQEAAEIVGCNWYQKLFMVMLPTSLGQLLLGLNQAIMLGFGMLVITALVGSRGLEEVTLVAVAQVRPGLGILAGLGIAVLAIVTDNLLQAAARRFAGADARSERSA
ncbi:ABC transporter permease subunit [Rhizobium sp. AQ_MP]|uniref:ABC transporter permease subunit n=1 Tax=Rhizobium sp. AQ_MP TaxID=2761536 RepID=UPI00163AE8A3|nr:ABC transporter permease subunit [Rhizobium sp. AQ_MP]